MPTSALQASQVVSLAGLIIAAVGLAARWYQARRRPAPSDLAPAKGDPSRGVIYAFTLGMMPWAKESTRLHAGAHLRGVGFHVAIFAGLAALAASPIWPLLSNPARVGVSAILAAGALLGAAGAGARWLEPNLRALSTADDHLAVGLVTLFLALEAAALWVPVFLASMYLAAGLMLAYIPLGKIRHCLFFFASRRFFGRLAGRRGVLPHPPGQAAATRWAP